MKLIIDICNQCGGEFTKTGQNHRFCSRTCRGKANFINYVRAWYLRKPELTMFSRAKHRAKRKSLEFTIKKEDIKIPEICPILGIKIESNQTGRSGFFNNSPSLDRINPNKGYTKDNIRVISNRANLLKSNANINELELILKDLRSCELSLT